LQHSYEQKSVATCMEEKILLFFFIFFYKSFPISGIAKLLQSIPINCLLKLCKIFIICRDPKLVPHIATPTQRWATSKQKS